MQEPRPECFQCQSEWKLASSSSKGPTRGSSELEGSSTKLLPREPCTRRSGTPVGFSQSRSSAARARCKFQGVGVADTDRCSCAERDAFRVNPDKDGKLVRPRTPICREQSQQCPPTPRIWRVGSATAIASSAIRRDLGQEFWAGEGSLWSVQLLVQRSRRARGNQPPCASYGPCSAECS